MKAEILDEIIHCLPTERTLFHYFKGQYAYNLLSYAMEHPQSIREVKQSAFGRLLGQPGIKSLLAKQGNGELSADLFQHVWQHSSEPFVLSIARWGRQDSWGVQTTRQGQNLVLQLNFSEKHNRAFQRLVKPEDEFIFNTPAHPVMERNRHNRFRDTLAWARIDLDMDTGEALIEEIQSDWIRDVKECLEEIGKGRKPWHLEYCGCTQEAFITYAKEIFPPYAAMWAEAMLMATIQFIYVELGINKIFYHTYETGQKIKRICGKPPRSLYSDLPRKFCFQKTANDPEFLQQERSFKRVKRKIKDTYWYQLAL